jgi:hypothetical protein
MVVGLIVAFTHRYNGVLSTDTAYVTLHDTGHQSEIQVKIVAQGDNFHFPLFGMDQ